MPARAATRATAGSPSVCIIRVNPVGPNTRGVAAGRPRIVVEVSTVETSSTRGWNSTRAYAPGAAQADLVAGGAVGVVEHRAGHGAARSAAGQD